MATYYVSPSGSALWASATNSATPAAVSTALVNAVAGDIVRFLSGDYYPPNAPNYYQAAWRPTNDGTAGNPITFISDVRHGAIIHDAANAGTGENRSAIGSYQNSYITFDGFTYLADLQSGIEVEHFMYINSSDHIHVQNVTATGWAHQDHTNGAIIGVYGDVSDSTDIYIHHNTLHDMTNDLTPLEAVVNASAIYIFEANGVYVYNNTIYNVNNGVSWKTSPQNIHVYNNYLYNVNRNTFFPTIEVAGMNNHYIHHNIARNVNRFLDVEESPAGGGTWSTLHVYNNTVYNDASHPFGVVYVAPSGTANVSGGVVCGQNSASQTVRGFQFYNNIFHASTTSRLHEIHDDLTSGAMLVTPFDYNCYYISSGTIRYIYNGSSETSFVNYQTAISAEGEANSITTTPSFVNAGGTVVEDYQLNGGGCIGTGYGGVDMGAWQGQSSIGNDEIDAESSSGTLAFFLR
jgi:hypothetical protein